MNARTLSGLLRNCITLSMAAWLVMTSSAHASSTAMLAYGKSGGGGAPRYRIWNGSSWGAEASANNIGSDPQWTVLRGSPVSNQFALATIDNNSDVEVQIWNGASWGSTFQATNNTGTLTARVFDLAYEQLSGDILLVYRESGTSNVRYRTYNGSSWSGESSYSVTSDDLDWLNLIPKPGSDEIMLLASTEPSNNGNGNGNGNGNNNGSNETIAAMWNGSSFSNKTTLTSDSSVSLSEHADGAFEGLSGQGLAVANQNSNNVAYRTLTSATWSGSLSTPSIGGKTAWTRMVSDTMGNQIIMVTHDSKKDVNLTVWSGSAWGSPVQVESNTSGTTNRAMDVCYEPGGQKALVVYEQNGSSTLMYRTWNGSAWSSQQPGPSGGTDPFWNPQTVKGLVTSQIFVTFATDAAQIRTMTWNGSSMSASTVIATSSAPKSNENFMVAVSGGGTPKITLWHEVQR